jgi:hypothetical protein
VAVWWFFAGREQLCGGWRVRAPWYGRRPCPAGAGPSPPELRIDFHDHEGFTVRGDCEVFMITGICGLAGTAGWRALRAGGHCGVAGAEERREAGPRLPPETAAVGHPGRRVPGRRAPRLRTRTLLADTPQPHQCHIGTVRPDRATPAISSTGRTRPVAALYSVRSTAADAGWMGRREHLLRSPA